MFSNSTDKLSSAFTRLAWPNLAALSFLLMGAGPILWVVSTPRCARP